MNLTDLLIVCGVIGLAVGALWMQRKKGSSCHGCSGCHGQCSPTGQKPSTLMERYRQDHPSCESNASCCMKK